MTSDPLGQSPGPTPRIPVPTPRIDKLADAYAKANEKFVIPMGLTGKIVWANDSIYDTTKGGKMYIDPKTLKPCKHKWVPNLQDSRGSLADPLAKAPGWYLTAECRKCGAPAKAGDKISLRSLVKQLG